MTLKSDAKFKEKLTCSFKYDMRNFVNIHPTTQKSKYFTSTGYFCLKYIWFELKNREELSSMILNSEQWCKIWINPDLAVSKMAWGIGWTFIRALKSLKIINWWSLFVQSIYIYMYICFSKKISEELCIMALKGDSEFKGKLICGLKKDIRNLLNFHVSSWKSKNLYFDHIFLSKAYKDLDEKVQKS